MVTCFLFRLGHGITDQRTTFFLAKIQRGLCSSPLPCPFPPTGAAGGARGDLDAGDDLKGVGAAEGEEAAAAVCVHQVRGPRPHRGARGALGRGGEEGRGWEMTLRPLLRPRGVWWPTH